VVAILVVLIVVRDLPGNGIAQRRGLVVAPAPSATATAAA